ncbi:mycoredoxin [Streptomyces sp. NBRC 109706]|uniref:mycoredoxin n=1 Tax=Streptomyces sp. NBRC 109706 TaxID=1550035 RepID=UPI0007809847|nr:mycoredoxin [Streptomyces sp. NBRC 109706]
MQGNVTMYSTPWCGYCRRLKSQLDREGIAFTEIDIEQDPEAVKLVEAANNGNQTVPTVVVTGGGGTETTMTNPSLADVKKALAA